MNRCFAEFFVLAKVSLICGFLIFPANGQELDDIPVRGVVVALQEAVISAVSSFPVAKINGRVGSVFEKGDQLLEFDCGLLEAQQKMVGIELSIAQADHTNNIQMQTRGAIAGHDVILSELAEEKAKAALEEVKEQLRFCQIDAPFSGSFSEINVKLLQVPNIGDPVMRLVSNEAFEVEMIVPSSWLSWVSKGTKFTIDVEELNVATDGVIIRTGSVIDPVSQTVHMYGSINHSKNKFTPGMSGLVTIKSD